MRRRRHDFGDDIAFEEAVAHDWESNLGTAEIPFRGRAMGTLKITAVALMAIVVGRVAALAWQSGYLYTPRASANASQRERIQAPRGLIVDRHGTILADNEAVFSAVLDIREFLRNEDAQQIVARIAQETLGIAPDVLWSMVRERNEHQVVDPLVLAPRLTQVQTVQLKTANIPGLSVVDSYQRVYPKKEAFATILGYTGLANPDDLEADPSLSSQDQIGKGSIELQYDARLRGTPGIAQSLHDARGSQVSDQKQVDPKIGATLNLTIDAQLQEFFYDRMKTALDALGAGGGVGMAMDPQTGEVLAMVSLPSYDNNIFVSPGRAEEKKQLLEAEFYPLVNRAIGGVYAPGSTIKPLVGLAALEERVATPEFTVFSPGYLEVPNPYNPDNPTKFLDWKFQGTVNVYSAIAQSSNVYFYVVGGGHGGTKGLGITRLRKWWSKFGLGEKTGIDLPGEKLGFLPSPEWKEEVKKSPWLLGDTYNVSIGQGDLLVTPLQLLNYISAFANGGRRMRPYVSTYAGSPVEIERYDDLAANIAKIREGMRETVIAEQGTARLLKSLPFPVAGKTGSAQILNNRKENAFFVGFGPYSEDPREARIALLILVEDAKQGSLNAVPIANEVFYWYWQNRLAAGDDNEKE